MKSLASDKRSVAFDTKSTEIWQKSIRIQQDIARKSITFDKKSAAFDTKSNGNYRKSIRGQ